eukprot:GAHX01002594.1.p1 GENE.GAHX01002594.1~~GAHX01002594.1.p1  ORF type:complete len:224 (-),score=33.62 GAHX01002594.1:204-875(-)
MHNFTFVFILLIGFLSQTERTEVLFSHLRDDIQLPEWLRTSSYSDGFKVALIAMKVYSLVKTDVKLNYIEKYEDFHTFSNKDYSVFRSLRQFIYRLVCQKYKTVYKNKIALDFGTMFETKCIAAIKFQKVKRGHSINKMIKKSRKAIIATYFMRRINEKGEIFVFELAVLLEIKRTIKVGNKIVYKCVYINTFNEIKTIYFKIEKGRFICEDMFILRPWYYIE